MILNIIKLLLILDKKVKRHNSNHKFDCNRHHRRRDWRVDRVALPPLTVRRWRHNGLVRSWGAVVREGEGFGGDGEELRVRWVDPPPQELVRQTSRATFRFVWELVFFYKLSDMLIKYKIYFLELSCFILFL